ncbi:N-acetyltransferase family protein [Streptomyces sp. NPDC000880]
MNEKQSMTTESFNPYADDDVTTLTAMYEAFLLEELQRTGEFALGVPVATWLETVIIRIDGEPAGFCAIDFPRRSVELIYVAPDHRSRGIATVLLADLARSCPDPMQLKAPLTPGAEAIAVRLGLGLAHSTDEQQATARAAITRMYHSINQRCRHRRTGDPSKPCKRCARTTLPKAAALAIANHAFAIRTGGMSR